MREPAQGQSILGKGSPGGNGDSQAQAAGSNPGQDEVKVQIEPPGEIPVYQFVDQQGSLVLQVPPQQMINLAQQIAQELAEETEPRADAAGEGGQSDGH
jgi:hypothetical protein